MWEQGCLGTVFFYNQPSQGKVLSACAERVCWDSVLSECAEWVCWASVMSGCTEWVCWVSVLSEWAEWVYWVRWVSVLSECAESAEECAEWVCWVSEWVCCASGSWITPTLTTLWLVMEIWVRQFSWLKRVIQQLERNKLLLNKSKKMFFFLSIGENRSSIKMLWSKTGTVLTDEGPKLLPYNLSVYIM